MGIRAKMVASLGILVCVLAVVLRAGSAPPVAADVLVDGFNAVPCDGAVYTPVDPTFTAMPGATAYFGLYEGGSYRFEVPNSWNGGLLMYMHGTAQGPNLSASVPAAYRTWAIANGFA